MIVLDSSAAVDYLADLEPGPWVVEQLRLDPDVQAPHLLDVEVAGALRRLVASGVLSAARAREALEDLVDLPVRRYPHVPLLERIWQLRANLTASDGCFVALAEMLDAPLVTTDRGIAGAPGVRATIVAPRAR